VPKYGSLQAEYIRTFLEKKRKGESTIKKEVEGCRKSCDGKERGRGFLYNAGNRGSHDRASGGS